MLHIDLTHLTPADKKLYLFGIAISMVALCTESFITNKLQRMLPCFKQSIGDRFLKPVERTLVKSRSMNGKDDVMHIVIRG